MIDFVLCGLTIMRKRDGIDDVAGKGALIFAPIEYIKKKKPKIIIAENSPLLATKFKHIATIIKDTVTGFGYKVEDMLLNSKDYGLPNERNRWYLTAIRLDTLRSRCIVPVHAPAFGYRVPLCCIIKPLPSPHYKAVPEGTSNKIKRAQMNFAWAIQKAVADGVDPRSFPVIVDTGSSAKFRVSSHNGVCMTLTKTRCAARDYWCSRACV